MKATSKSTRRFKKEDVKGCWGKNKSTRSLPGEKWKPVPGLEDTHEVSSYGRFRCLDKMIYPVNSKSPYLRKGHIMSPTVSATPNYFAKDFTYNIAISVEVKQDVFHFSMRRLVYHCFVAPIELHDGHSPQYLIVPKDGNGLNTHYKNLVKLTKSEYELLIYQKNRIANTFRLLSREKRSDMARKGAQKRNMEVSQYDQQGHKIASYPSLTEASLRTQTRLSTLGNALNGRVKTAGGFVWRYGNGPQKIELGDWLTQKLEAHIAKTAQPITQYDGEGAPVAVYSSIREACRATGFQKTTLSACLNGRLKTAYGFVWRKGIGPNKMAGAIS